MPPLPTLQEHYLVHGVREARDRAMCNLCAALHAGEGGEEEGGGGGGGVEEDGAGGGGVEGGEWKRKITSQQRSKTYDDLTDWLHLDRCQRPKPKL